MHLHYGLDGLSPLGIWHAEHTDARDACQLHDDRFHLGWIDVFPPRFNECLFRFALHVVEVPVRVEAADVTGVMPTAPEGLGCDVREVKVALKYDRTTHQNFSWRADGNISIRFIYQSDLTQRSPLASTARMVCHPLERHKATRLSLAKPGPKLSRRARVQTGHRVWSLQPYDILETRELTPHLRRGVQQLGEDWRKTGHIGDAMRVNELHSLARLK